MFSSITAFPPQRDSHRDWKPSLKNIFKIHTKGFSPKKLGGTSNQKGIQTLLPVYGSPPTPKHCKQASKPHIGANKKHFWKVTPRELFTTIRLGKGPRTPHFPRPRSRQPADTPVRTAPLVGGVQSPRFPAAPLPSVIPHRRFVGRYRAWGSGGTAPLLRPRSAGRRSSEFS